MVAVARRTNGRRRRAAVPTLTVALVVLALRTLSYYQHRSDVVISLLDDGPDGGATATGQVTADNGVAGGGPTDQYCVAPVNHEATTSANVVPSAKESATNRLTGVAAISGGSAPVVAGVTRIGYSSFCRSAVVAVGFAAPATATAAVDDPHYTEVQRTAAFQAAAGDAAEKTCATIAVGALSFLEERCEAALAGTFTVKSIPGLTEQTVCSAATAVSELLGQTSATEVSA